MWFTHLDSQVDNLISEAWVTRYSSSSSFGRVEHYGHAGRHEVDHYQRLHTPNKLLRRRKPSFHRPSDANNNNNIPPTSSCAGGNLPSLDHLMTMTHTIRLGGNILDSMISGSNFGVLNWDSPTRLPSNAHPSSPDVSLASVSLITCTNWQTKTNLGSDHLPIIISLRMDSTMNPIPYRTSFNLKKAKCDIYRKEIEKKLSKRWIPTNCQKMRKNIAYHHSESSITPYTLGPTPYEYRAGKDESTRWPQI